MEKREPVFRKKRCGPAGPGAGRVRTATQSAAAGEPPGRSGVPRNMKLPMTKDLLSRPWMTILLAAAGLFAALLILLACMPLSWGKAMAERALSRQTGGTATIGALERETAFSLRPVVRLSDIVVPQPRWAGPGDVARIAQLRVRLPILPLLIGRLQAVPVSARGVRLNLVRDGEGRMNWRPQTRERDHDGAPRDAAMRLEDVVIDYRDALRKRRFTLSLAATPEAGLHGAGTGAVDGAPVRLAVKGAPMVAGRPWPFEASIDGAALAMHARGEMAGPLRLDDLHMRVEARADDLKRIDRVIEAGLFGTRAVDLSADVRHAGPDWTIESLRGTVGASHLTGRLSARKVDGRMKLDGAVRFANLDFEDLADDAGRARAIALERREGLRLVPDTRINIRKIDRTDGRIAVRVDRITGGRRPSSLTGLQAVLMLQDRVLTVSPLRIDLGQGAITGRAVIDQRAGQPKPTVTLALDMTGSSIAALAGGASGGENEIDGRVDARARLTGVGDTVREAVGTSSGTIGIVARAGAMPTKIAALIGFDVGRSLFGDGDRPAGLRCAVLAARVQGGRAQAGTLVIDTTISQSRGAGTIVFPDEALDLRMTGAPKGDTTLRLPGTVNLRGTIRAPRIVVPEGTRSLGNILKAVGRAIGGDDRARAVDADCPALVRAAIGR